MKRVLLVAVLLSALGSSALPAQTPKAGEDALAQLLFDPQLVLKHAKEIRLESSQRAAIVAAIKTAQGNILDRQLQMAESYEELLKAVQGTRVEEQATVTMAGKVLGLEREVKQEQLQLLIRVKNVLNQAQQEQLQALKKSNEEGE
jgi:hypothetical protein